MQVYHGSYLEIYEIDLNKCQANRDFGQGFYLTKFVLQAQNWAKIIGRKHHTDGFVTEFTFYERAFEDERYKTLRFDKYSEKWLDFVVLVSVAQHFYFINSKHHILLFCNSRFLKHNQKTAKFGLK